MADKYLSAYYNGNNGNKIYLELHVYTVATSIANNTTTERADLYAVVNDASYGWWNSYGSEAHINVNANTTTRTVNFDYRSTGVKGLISTWDTVVKHDNNGNASIPISAHHYSGLGLGNASVSGTYICDNIPRYATSNQSLNNKTETTITMNWSSDNIIDYIWYSTNNGSTWAGVDVTDGTSGTYTISGLSANTTYNIKTRVRRKDSQLTTDSGSLAVKTYSYPIQSLNNKTETEIVINWNCDGTVDMIYYSIDGGGNWSNGINVNATSGNYTISGLSANTNYNIITRVRRRDTQTLSNTSSLNVTTYQYPYVTAIGTNNLVIGNSQTLTLYNPLGRNVNVYMYQHTTGIQLYKGTSNGTSVTFTPTVDTMYSSIPNSQKGDCYYYCEYYGQIKNYVNGNYSINVNANIPTIVDGGWGYYDDNEIIRNLTGNNKILVNNLSNVFVSVSGDAISIKNSATLSSIKATIGDKSVSLNYNRTTNEYTGIIYGVNNSAIFIIIIDSRGIQNTYSIDVNNDGLWRDWILPSIKEQSALRLNGVGTMGLINAEGTYWNKNFGIVDNTIYKIWYRYAIVNQAWSELIEITDSFDIDNGKFISKNDKYFPTTDNGDIFVEFELGKNYYIQYVIQDKTGQMFYASGTTMTSGIPCTAKVKKSDGTYSVGINKLPNEEHALDVGGSLNLESLFINEEITISKDDDGSIYICATNSKNHPPIVFRPNGLSDGKGQAYFDTNGNLVLSSTVKTQSGKYIMDFRGHVNDGFTFNQAIDTGIYSVGSYNGLPDAPYTGWIYGVLEVIVNDMTTWNKSDNWIFQRFRTTAGLIYERQAINADNWTSWKQIAQNVGISAYKDVKTLYDVGSADWNGQTDGDSYLVTKAFMAFWNGAYLNTNSNLKYCHEGTIQAKPITLYSNTSGTTGTVTLSQSAANFNYIEIMYRRNANLEVWNNHFFESTRLSEPNGKMASLSVSYPAETTTTQISTKLVLVSGTSITVKRECYANIVQGSAGQAGTQSQLFIVKVLGYR